MQSQERQFGDEFFTLIGDILMEVLDEKYNTDDFGELDPQ